MVFNSNVFLLLFFPIVFILFWGSKTKRQRYTLLTISGYIFYGYWNWRYCFLLLFSSLVSYFAAILMDESNTQGKKRLWLYLSIGVDLALLGFFKYYNFSANTINTITGSNFAPVIDVILPVGISFYTFHTISYIVDVSKGQVKATRNIWEYFTYVCLFSQLVAGPIVRFRQIEDDLENIDQGLSEGYVAKGIGFFTVGMIKKVIIADSIATLVNPLLANYQALSWSNAWAAAFGYTFQLYYDFSGYSDMAIGLGFLFGIRIPQNFNAPYQSLGISDFWRRWHISLSSWLRDYLYISLGGNRSGRTRTNVNLLITMVLGGLWHGANWTFIVWGAYHGILLILDRIAEPITSKLSTVVHRALTFFMVIIGWVIFRATDFHMASVWLRKMAGIGTSVGTDPNTRLWGIVVVCLIASNTLPASWEFKFKPGAPLAFGLALALFISYLFMNSADSVFLYYQF